ncbi:chemotaxis protein CheW [Aminiphilus sp.]|uniref:chemotaxis protein CheW n=1 Tax=Aminiphilus sp. TaxID=1872488 RepID=UPI002637FF26|nr:chemotaxis protein CheW [Aminiphilus sp.]
MEQLGGKYLTFALGKEEYGIPIQRVKEIIGMMEITGVPRTPDFIKGVINLRGKIIPLMDLRLKFGLPEKPYSERTCIIVVEVASEEERGVRTTGIAVDMVSEVVNIADGDVEQPPRYGNGVDIRFLRGMGKVKGKVVMLLDMDRVLSAEEFALLGDVKGV